MLYGQILINFVAVTADLSETPTSCAKRLNNFRGLILVMSQYPELLLQSAQSSSIASLCPTLNLWPTAFSQIEIQTTLRESASQDIYNETYGYIFCNVIPRKSVDNRLIVRY
jgi:hypothetical protein